MLSNFRASRPTRAATAESAIQLSDIGQSMFAIERHSVRPAGARSLHAASGVAVTRINMALISSHVVPKAIVSILVMVVLLPEM
jgi:hypothetical protein